MNLLNLSNDLEVCYSFDTTGSMYPCITQLRRDLRANIERLAKQIPGIRIAIFAHGDYGDERNYGYTTKHIDFTTDYKKITDFIANVGGTGGGGNGGEAYERVMHEVQSLSWTPGYKRTLVMIGDEPPHLPNYHENVKRYDWKVEAKKLAEMNIPIYAVQALNRYESTPFWRQFASLTDGLHISLDQLSYITELFLAVCLKQQGNEQVEAYEQEVTTARRMDRGMTKIFDALLGRSGSASRATAQYGSADDLQAVAPGRFQVLQVYNDAVIKNFVEDAGALFKTGRGFYEFTKREEIQAYKEVVLQDRNSGDMFTGEKARELMGVGAGMANLSPKEVSNINQKYRIFVQSTSFNRKLKGGTLFLYEVDDTN